MARFLDAHSMLEIDGVLEVVPRDHSLLTPELRARVEGLIKQEQADLDKRRTARRQARIHTQTTPQETQP